jgi:uncharacterized protein
MSDKIQEFLSLRRIAIVGVSQRPNDFSRMLYRAFRDRGFDVVPVNPGVRVIDDRYCFPRLQDVEPAVEGALLMTSPEVSELVVQDCFAAGVRRIWIYRHSPAAEEWCAARGVAVVAGECPMMYLENAGWIHRVHRWFHDRAAT